MYLWAKRLHHKRDSNLQIQLGPLILSGMTHWIVKKI